MIKTRKPKINWKNPEEVRAYNRAAQAHLRSRKKAEKEAALKDSKYKWREYYQKNKETILRQQKERRKLKKIQDSVMLKRDEISIKQQKQKRIPTGISIKRSDYNSAKEYQQAYNKQYYQKIRNGRGNESEISKIITKPETKKEVVVLKIVIEIL